MSKTIKIRKNITHSLIHVTIFLTLTKIYFEIYIQDVCGPKTLVYKRAKRKLNKNKPSRDTKKLSNFVVSRTRHELNVSPMESKFKLANVLRGYDILLKIISPVWLLLIVIYIVDNIVSAWTPMIF